MADKFLTLLDITKRNGTDQSVGLVEEVNTESPEIREISGRPIAGTTYKTRVRTALPAGPAFRQANEGSDTIASAYTQKLSQCFFMDGVINVDESVADAPEEGGREGVLADEAVGVMSQKSIALGTQFYYGTDADAKGFAGLNASYDATNCLIKAGGTTSSVQTSAWIIWNDLKGVHFIFGNNTGLQMNPWTRQQITDANGKKFFAWVNNVSGWIGLSFNHTKSAIRIANCEDATNKNLSDAVISRALELLPLNIRRSGGLKILVNRKGLGQLQRSRSVTIFTGAVGKATGSIETVAPLPTEAFNVPIICTDSITNTEAVVA